ncbi:MAG: S1 RNA-binding domain-containing protein [Pseudonocardiaceae bacterium]
MSHSEHRVPLSVWTDFLARHAGGGVLNGRVMQVVAFGAFVEVAEGVVGLLHQSEWSARPEPGSSISVTIAEVDLENRRMSLLPA